jgi:PKD repeat protein
VVVGVSATLAAPASLDAAGDATSFVWSFGDGTGGEGAAVSHAWALPGVYLVTVTVTHADGSVSQAQSEVTVVPPGVVLDGGAEFTRIPAVTITVTPPAGAVALSVRDNTEPAAGTVLPLAPRVRWTLSPGDGPHSVSVTFLDADGAPIGSYEAGITLDTTPPRVRAATLAPTSAPPACGVLAPSALEPRRELKLRVSAEDAVSGPADVQAGLGGRPLEPWSPVGAPLELSLPEGIRAQVRVRDRAGNVSPWRAVKVPVLPVPFDQSLSEPFADDCAERPVTAADDLTPFWADGLPCSVGCRPAGAIAGWPLRPFHRQHALRAGLNERRGRSFHYGIDIQARDLEKVYAIQPGVARILRRAGADSRVQVGNYIYWHVYPAVRDGQRVSAYSTLVGRVGRGRGHLHLSEVDGQGRYLNLLRRGGRVLQPWSDTLPPVIGPPRIAPDGEVTVAVYDPQSWRERTSYDTPVLAPAALAYRLFTVGGGRIGPLRWALRGSHNLDFSLIGAVFAPEAHAPGAACFERREICRPDWRYRLAGGLAPRIDPGALGPGRYRLSIYAWDWAGNTRARDAFVIVRGDRVLLAPGRLQG